MLARSLALLLLATAACMPEAPPGSSGGTGGGGGDGGADGESAVDPQREALCNSYASAAAQCCASSPGTCPSDSATVWKNHCLDSARRCPAMPTCFSGGDCNTLEYCGGGC